MDVYQAPASQVAPEEPGYRELVLGWEKRRLKYNLILLVPGLLALLAWSYRDFTQLIILLPGALFFGLGANACYFLGPLAELYAQAFFKGIRCRNVLFWFGLALSLLIILGCALLGLAASAFGPSI